MTEPRVSIVIPTYNRGYLIRAAIDSVLDQTYSNFEILVIDDGSTDNTREIINSIEDTRINYIYIDHSGRPAVPRNVGIEKSRGQFVAFLDSDDVWVPEKLEIQLAVIDHNHGVNICYGNAKLFDENGYRGIELKSPFKRDGLIANSLLLRNCVPMVTAIVCKGFLDKYKLRFNEQLTAIEDYDLWLRAAVVGARFKFIRKVLGHYRLHASQLSNTANDKEIIRYILDQDVIRQNSSRIVRKLAKLIRGI